MRLYEVTGSWFGIRKVGMGLVEFKVEVRRAVSRRYVRLA